MLRKFKLKRIASLKMISRKVQNEFKIWRVYLQARSPPRLAFRCHQRSLSIALADLVILSGPVSTRYSIFVFVLVFDICIRIFNANTNAVSDYHTGPRTTTHISNMHTCLRPLCCQKINRTASVSKNQEDKIDAKYAIEINWRK